MRAGQSIIPILAVCHRDLAAANRWLRWAAFLSGQKGGNVSKNKLVVFLTKRAAEMELELPDAKTFFDVDVRTCPDELELGYPISANHLFLRSLELAERKWPDLHPMFIEPDCVPIRHDWFSEVQDEYIKSVAAFMGGLTEGGHPHMTGNAIYTRDWRKKAPSILTVMERQNSGGMFPNGRGFPFDLWIASDVLKDFHRAKTIFQVWNPGRWHAGNLDRIQPGAVLVHQDKIGTLIAAIARRDYPEYIKLMPEPSAFFALQGNTSTVTVDGITFEFTPCNRTPGGTVWSVFRPSDPMDEEVLRSIDGKRGVMSITQEDYKALLSQRK